MKNKNVKYSKYKRLKKKGLKYYRKKKYIKAISFFEKALVEFRDDPQIYLYLGYSSVKINDIDGARRYFKSGSIIDENNTELKKGLAFIYLKDERIEDAISLWGEVLKERPLDKKVKRALKKLRVAEDLRKFAENARPEEYLSMKPPFFVKIKPYFISITVVVIVTVAGVIFYTSPLYEKALQKYFPKVAELKSINLPVEKNLVSENAEGALYYFKESELKEAFVKVKKLIYRNKINSAIVLLNKIMHSNASPQTKEKFKILYKFIETPDPFSLDYNPQFYEIVKDPIAYRGVFILWDGRVANLIKGKNLIEFDLLVNYINEDTIAGIAHVKMPGKYFIENKEKVEVFGRYTGYDKKNGKLFIEGILLKKLGI